MSTALIHRSSQKLNPGFQSFGQHPDISRYCLIIQSEGLRFLYRPYGDRVDLLFMPGCFLDDVQIRRLTIFSYKLDVKSLGGRVSGSLELLIQSAEPPDDGRVMEFRDAISRLVQIRAGLRVGEC